MCAFVWLGEMGIFVSELDLFTLIHQQQNYEICLLLLHFLLKKIEHELLKSNKVHCTNTDYCKYLSIGLLILYDKLCKIYIIYVIGTIQIYLKNCISRNLWISPFFLDTQRRVPFGNSCLSPSPRITCITSLKVKRNGHW